MKASKLSLVMLVISVVFVMSWDCRSEELQFTSPRTEISPPSGEETSPAFYPPDLMLAVPDAPGPGVGLNQRIIRTVGCQDSEIAVAASPDGRNVIVASNGDFIVSSQDGGTNWSAPAAWPAGGGSTQGDPMLSVGLSGRVYLSFIWNNPAPSCDFGLAVSTNQGQNFAAPVSSVTCPPSGGGCFPDQETTATDQMNAGSAGGDQIYLTWRQFTNIGCPQSGPGNEDASIVCSQDNGQNSLENYDI